MTGRYQQDYTAIGPATARLSWKICIAEL